MDIKMNIRPSSSTGVLFALVQNNTVPLSVAVVTQGEDAVSSFALLLEISTHVSLCMSAHIYMYKHRHTWLKCAMLLTSMLQNLQVFLDGVSVATLDSLMLCYPDRMTVQLNVTPKEIQISANTSTVTYMKSDALWEALKHLNSTMQNPISTYIGGIPG